jgi:hypothetical protein
MLGFYFENLKIKIINIVSHSYVKGGLGGNVKDVVV